MALVAVCGVKGSPGATTTAVGLAVSLPTAARPVVVECDPAGGDLAARRGLAAGRGLVGLATAVRAGGAGPSGDLFSAHSWRVAVGTASVELVVAPPGAVQTRAALTVLAGHPRLLDPPDRVVVADCGRAEAPTAAWPIMATAATLLVVAGGTVESVAHSLELLPQLARATRDRRVAVVLSGRGPYRADEIEDLLARRGLTVPVLGSLPEDSRSAALLNGTGGGPGSRWARRALPAALSRLAGLLYSPPAPAALPNGTAAGSRLLASEGMR